MAKLPAVTSSPLAAASALGDWHAHLYHMDRRQCVLFCHDDSRYVLFLPGVRRDKFEDLGRWHRELFLAVLVGEHVSTASLRRVELALGWLYCDTRTDRSVLASMNIARDDLQACVVRVDNVVDLDPVATALKLNERPASVRGQWHMPREQMLRRVAALG